MDFVTVSDLSAAAFGALFSFAYNNSGSPARLASQGLVVSIIARMASTSTTFAEAVPSMKEGAKNQVIVAIFSACASYYRGGSLLRGVLSGVSIDLLAAETLKILQFDDKALISSKKTGE
jgi:hypothetical protein